MFGEGVQLFLSVLLPFRLPCCGILALDDRKSCPLPAHPDILFILRALMWADAGAVVLGLAMGTIEAESFSRVGDEIADAVIGLCVKPADMIDDLDFLPVKGTPVGDPNDGFGPLAASIDPDLLTHARLLY